MELAFILTSSLLVLYGILGFYDGVFLHLYKYRLHARAESKNEHISHTVRALLFPAILYFIFLNPSTLGFGIGLAFVALDILTLTADAYMEGDSRKFMGGLPRWEYIVHLFVNGFHFAALSVFLAAKVDLSPDGMRLVTDFSHVSSYGAFQFIVQNLIPGAVIIGFLHLFLMLPTFQSYFHKLSLPCCKPATNIN